MGRSPGTRCPHCKTTARARTSTELSLMYREITYVCNNLECGHVWVCGLEPRRTLSPSAIPDPEIDIPLSRHVAKRQLVRQLTLSLERDPDESS